MIASETARAASRLDNRETTFPPQGVAPPPKTAVSTGRAPDPARRRQRFELRATAARLLHGEAVFRCGQHVAWQGGRDDGERFATIKLGARGAHWSGVVTCKSVWHCPVCAAKIAAGRRDEVRRVIDAHQAAGGVVYLATFTMPHHAFQEPRHLRRGVSLAFSKVLAGRQWQQLRRLAGVVGMIRALEVTHGQNGWHPHLHVLVLARSAAAVEAAAFGDAIFARWSRVISRAGFGRCSQNAWQFDLCASAEDAGEYAAKWGPDYELTHGHIKDSKGGRSPWRILRDYAERGDARDGDLFREYALAFKGARQLTWSNGLKELFGLADESDEALADREPPARAVAKVHEDALRVLVRRGLAARALEIVEREGAAGLVRFMALLGFDGAAVRLVEPPPDPPERVPLTDQEALARIFGVAPEYFAAGVQ